VQAIATVGGAAFARFEAYAARREAAGGNQREKTRDPLSNTALVHPGDLDEVHLRHTLPLDRPTIGSIRAVSGRLSLAR
jgi:hypothetical protein